MTAPTHSGDAKSPAGTRIRPTLKEQAYEQIEEAIVTLKLPPGAVVSELAMSEMTGIGRTPIRG